MPEVARGTEKPNILVFGFERHGYQLSDKMVEKHFVLHFESFDTDHRFEEYDGVIMFKSTFKARSGHSG